MINPKKCFRQQGEYHFEVSQHPFLEEKYFSYTVGTNLVRVDTLPHRCSWLSLIAVLAGQKLQLILFCPLVLASGCLSGPGSDRCTALNDADEAAVWSRLSLLHVYF